MPILCTCPYPGCFYVSGYYQRLSIVFMSLIRFWDISRTLPLLTLSFLANPHGSTSEVNFCSIKGCSVLTFILHTSHLYFMMFLIIVRLFYLLIFLCPFIWICIEDPSSLVWLFSLPVCVNAVLSSVSSFFKHFLSS